MLVSEETAFTVTVNSQQRDAFIAGALAEGCTASEVIAVLMREYVEQRQHAGDDDAFDRRQVEEGRASMRAGIGIPNELVEAESAEWCAAILRTA
ncbi:antitoxin of toxin-antitoxin stability system [Cupriavidus necator]